MRFQSLLLTALTLVSLGACHAQRAPVMVAGEGRVESPLLLLPARVCVERQADTIRRLRGGRAGLATTNEVVSTLGFALSPQRKLGAFESDACEYALEIGEPRTATRDIQRFVATPDLVRRLETTKSKTALVTEIAVRMICAPSRGGTPGSPCYEEDIEVMLLLFDQRGAIVRAASAHVDSADEALAIARAVVPATSEAPCRLLPNDTLDCT